MSMDLLLDEDDSPLRWRGEAGAGHSPNSTRNGVTANDVGGFDPGETVAPRLQGAGYHTAFVGKFLNGYHPGDVRPAGWSRWDALTRGVYDYVDFSMTGD